MHRQTDTKTDGCKNRREQEQTGAKMTIIVAQSFSPIVVRHAGIQKMEVILLNKGGEERFQFITSALKHQQEFKNLSHHNLCLLFKVRWSVIV